MSLCRGCAGTGIGHHVTPRTIAIIEVVMGYTWQLIDPENDRRDRWIRVGRSIHPAGVASHQARAGDGTSRGPTGALPTPLADALRRVEGLLRDGFVYADDCIPLEAAWLCTWCHGTGTPQLSVPTIESRMR